MLRALAWHLADQLQGGDRPMLRQTVFPEGKRTIYEDNKYSAAIKSGDLLFCSGHVGSREDGSPEPDFEKQVDLAYTNLVATLKAAGCTLDDIVDVTTFHTDLENQFEIIMEVRSRHVPGPEYPNWTAVGVAYLSGFDFEIKVIARIP
jgi:enamine deaminase RidA (YjgF/YER057c/UK114 family)